MGLFCVRWEVMDVFNLGNKRLISLARAERGLDKLCQTALLTKSLVQVSGGTHPQVVLGWEAGPSQGPSRGQRLGCSGCCSHIGNQRTQGSGGAAPEGSR